MLSLMDMEGQKEIEEVTQSNGIMEKSSQRMVWLGLRFGGGMRAALLAFAGRWLKVKLLAGIWGRPGEVQKADSSTLLTNRSD